MRDLEKENVRLKKIVAELELDKPIHIYPGSPLSAIASNRLPGRAWENGYNERFNGTLRREVLNAEWFTTIKQAQIVINHWLRQYNHTRPHQGLNMRPPVPETPIRNGPVLGARQSQALKH